MNILLKVPRRDLVLVGLLLTGLDDCSNGPPNGLLKASSSALPFTDVGEFATSKLDGSSDNPLNVLLKDSLFLPLGISEIVECTFELGGAPDDPTIGSVKDDLRSDGT